MKINKRNKRLLIVFLSVAILLVYSSLEPRWVKTTYVTIESHDIPKAFDGKRIVLVSDIHHGSALSKERVHKLVQRINDLKPDIIVLGGDYVSNEKKYIKPVFDELMLLKSNYGIFGVIGNHDYFVDGDLTLEMMKRNKINVCENKSYWIKIKNDSIKIGGVIDPDGDYDSNIDSTIHDVKKKDFCILITHRPDYIKTINTDLVDLTLSGHTHGGQVTFFGLWAPILPDVNGVAELEISKESQKYRYGLIHTKPNMQSYITSGIGTRSPHIRFFCRPEIAVLELKRK